MTSAACVGFVVLMVASCVVATTSPNYLYDIQFTDDPIPQNLFASPPSPSGEDNSDATPMPLLSYSPDGWQPMTLPNGSAYLCRVPSTGPTDASDEADKENSDILRDGQVLPSSVQAALSAAMQKICALRLDGWFSYDVCWEKHVRQYHLEGTSTKDEFFLGKGPDYKLEKGAPAELFYRIHTEQGPYVAAQFPNGTVCDLTGRDRATELRLFCQPEGADEAVKIEISEPETCKYIVSLFHPRACIPELRKVQGSLAPIICYKMSRVARGMMMQVPSRGSGRGAAARGRGANPGVQATTFGAPAPGRARGRAPQMQTAVKSSSRRGASASAATPGFSRPTSAFAAAAPQMPFRPFGSTPSSNTGSLFAAMPSASAAFGGRPQEPNSFSWVGGPTLDAPAGLFGSATPAPFGGPSGLFTSSPGGGNVFTGPSSGGFGGFGAPSSGFGAPPSGGLFGAPSSGFSPNIFGGCGFGAAAKVPWGSWGSEKVKEKLPDNAQFGLRLQQASPTKRKQHRKGDVPKPMFSDDFRYAKLLVSLSSEDQNAVCRELLQQYDSQENVIVDVPSPCFEERQAKAIKVKAAAVAPFRASNKAKVQEQLSFVF